MKTIRRILLILLLILVIAVLAGFLLPRKITVTRELTIKAAPDFLYDQVNTLPNWKKWSPWHRKDSGMQIQYSEPAQGSGAFYSWTSKTKGGVGSGKLTLGKCKPHTYIETLMDFGANGTATGYFKFEPVANKTKVIWSMVSDLGNNPIARYMGFYMIKMAGTDFEIGLDNLNQLALQMPKTSFEISETELPARNLLSIRDTASPQTITPKLGTHFGKIITLIQTKKLQFTGAPIAIYHSYTSTLFDMEAGIPVNKKIAPTGKIKFTEVLATKVVMAKYFGDYAKVEPAYNALQKYIENKKLEITGAPFEEYITDPTQEKDTAKWQTNIYFPVK